MKRFEYEHPVIKDNKPEVDVPFMHITPSELVDVANKMHDQLQKLGSLAIDWFTEKVDNERKDNNWLELSVHLSAIEHVKWQDPMVAAGVKDCIGRIRKKMKELEEREYPPADGEEE